MIILVFLCAVSTLNTSAFDGDDRDPETLSKYLGNHPYCASQDVRQDPFCLNSYYMDKSEMPFLGRSEGLDRSEPNLPGYLLFLLVGLLVGVVVGPHVLPKKIDVFY